MELDSVTDLTETVPIGSLGRRSPWPQVDDITSGLPDVGTNSLLGTASNPAGTLMTRSPQTQFEDIEFDDLFGTNAGDAFLSPENLSALEARQLGSAESALSDGSLLPSADVADSESALSEVPSTNSLMSRQVGVSQPLPSRLFSLC